MNKLKLVIVGGVTGSYFAAQYRRLDESAEITVIEQRDYVGFGFCGMPFVIGGVVPSSDTLMMFSAASLESRMAFNILTGTSLVAIARDTKEVVCRRTDEAEFRIAYDKLVLNLGSVSNLPAIEGLDTPGVFFFKFREDLLQTESWLKEHDVKHAAVIGSGFVGLEVADNLMHRGISVTLIEAEPQLAPRLDREFAYMVHSRLHESGCDIRVGTSATAIEQLADGRLEVDVSGRRVVADMVVVATGVHPNSRLAAEAGLAIGPTTGVETNAFMQTSDPDIYCMGDAAEVKCRITGEPILVSLASPAFQQGKTVSMHLAGFERPYPGGQNTFICKVRDATVGATGLTEARAKSLGLDYEKVVIQGQNHVVFYPGAAPIFLKVLFERDSGRLLGAQAFGQDGVDKRIDVLAAAISFGGTINDLEFLELAYSPPYGMPRDLINLAGSVGSVISLGIAEGLHPDELEGFLARGGVLLDLRTAEEFEIGTVPGAMNLPIAGLRDRMGELDRTRPIAVLCQIGSRSLAAQKTLSQQGFDCMNVVGGYAVWKMLSGKLPEAKAPPAAPAVRPDNPLEGCIRVDARGMLCPGPITLVAKACKERQRGDRLEILVTDTAFLDDFRTWVDRKGYRILEADTKPDHLAVILEL